MVVRELREVGFDVGTVRTHRRSELPEPERGFVVEFAVPLAQAGKTWRALVACRRQAGAIEREVIDSLKARLSQVPAEVGLIFATADFGTDALDRKSTRLNSSHTVISYAVFCLKKKKQNRITCSIIL